MSNQQELDKYFKNLFSGALSRISYGDPRNNMDVFPIARELIARGADVDYPNYQGETPLHLAGRRANIGIGHLLVEAGANVNAQCDRGRTPLHRTIRAMAQNRFSGGFSLVELLLCRGANSGIKNKEGLSARDWAVAAGEHLADVVKLIDYANSHSDFIASYDAYMRSDEPHHIAYNKRYFFLNDNAVPQLPAKPNGCPADKLEA